MINEDFVNEIKILKKEKINFISDTILWVNVAVNAMNTVDSTKTSLIVPSVKDPNKTKTISLSRFETVKSKIVEHDIFNTAFVSLVSAMEEYINRMIRLCLHFDNNRILNQIPGISFEKQISIVDFLKKERGSLIDEIIETNINKLFYAGPKKQFEYLETVFKVLISNETIEKWIEMKARRDLIVHNNSIINKVYMDKVKINIPLAIGSRLDVDEDYFTISALHMKVLIELIDKKIRSEFKKLDWTNKEQNDA